MYKIWSKDLWGFLKKCPTEGKLQTRCDVSDDIYTTPSHCFKKKHCKSKFSNKRYKFCKQILQYSATRFIINYRAMHDNQTCQ